ncbi:MAG: hypothetical protein N4A38_01530 [Candidatus Gracilibacteria bacterium]|nr:hypothetical protein [Candidatus Gracilibacteria bacterium]
MVNEENKKEILEICLSKVYASFFILRTQTGEKNGRQVINTFLQKMFKEENIPDNMILNISDYYDGYKDELKLGDVYLFPFIKIQLFGIGEIGIEPLILLITKVKIKKSLRKIRNRESGITTFLGKKLKI